MICWLNKIKTNKSFTRKKALVGQNQPAIHVHALFMARSVIPSFLIINTHFSGSRITDSHSHSHLQLKHYWLHLATLLFLYLLLLVPLDLPKLLHHPIIRTLNHQDPATPHRVAPHQAPPLTPPTLRMGGGHVQYLVIRLVQFQFRVGLVIPLVVLIGITLILLLDLLVIGEE